MIEVNIGKGITIDVDAAKLKDAVLTHVIKIGMRNILMDCHAGITKEKFVDYLQLSCEKAHAKLEAMYSGDIRVARETSGQSRDPVRAEALSMARKMVNLVFYFAPKDSAWKIKDTGQWINWKTSELASDYDLGTPDGMRAFHGGMVDRVADTCMEAAEVTVANRDKLKAIPINLAGLTKKA